MKYKHVFFIWLLADAFLALGLLCFTIYEMSTGSSSNDLEMFFLATAYGICISLPSLIVMLVFHAIFTSNAKDPADYSSAYIILIISINALYLLVSQLAMGMSRVFNAFYIGTTLAGLLAFYIIDKKIRKHSAVVNE